MNAISGAQKYRTLAAGIVPPQGAYIGGRFRPAVSGRVFENINPATGAVIGTVAACDAADVDAAVSAARRAFDAGAWSRAAPEVRKQVLLRLADLVRANTEELAILESIDSGKTIKDCLHEIGNEVPTFFQWYAELIDKSFGKVAPTAEATVGADREGADRRRRPRPAVELSAADGRLEARPGARRRLLRGPEAGGADAAHCAPARRAGVGSGRPRRRPERGPGLRGDRWTGHRPPSRYRSGLVHGLDRGRRLVPQIFEREQSQAGRSRDGRQEPVHRPRRRAPRRRPDLERRELRVLERWPELLGQHAPDHRGEAEGRVPREGAREGADAEAGRPARSGDADGLHDLPGASAPRPRLHRARPRRRRADRPRQRLRARAPGLLRRARRCSTV